MHVWVKETQAKLSGAQPRLTATLSICPCFPLHSHTIPPKSSHATFFRSLVDADFYYKVTEFVETAAIPRPLAEVCVCLFHTVLHDYETSSVM